MGQYLKDAYAERDLAKALAKAHGLIDEETKKLSDRVKELTLSHNRMRKLLILSKNFIAMVYQSSFVPNEVAEELHRKLALELYGLEGYIGLKRSVIVPKMDGPYELLDYIKLKGGKKCG